MHVNRLSMELGWIPKWFQWFFKAFWKDVYRFQKEIQCVFNGVWIDFRWNLDGISIDFGRNSIGFPIGVQRVLESFSIDFQCMRRDYQCFSNGFPIPLNEFSIDSGWIALS